MNSENIRDLVVTVLDDRKAEDIRVLDVRKITPITDYMVIATATSNRHVKALLDHVVEAAKQAGQRPVGIEGADSLDWVLLDLSDVVVHLMQAETRQFYDLERLWSELPSDNQSRV